MNDGRYAATCSTCGPGYCLIGFYPTESGALDAWEKHRLTEAHLAATPAK